MPKSVAANLNNIGVVYLNLGNYEKALSNFEYARKMGIELKMPKLIATSLNNIGSAYMDLGKYEKALANFENALKIRLELKKPYDIAENLTNIGGVYFYLKRFQEAEEKLVMAKEVRKNSGYEGKRSVGPEVEICLATERFNEALNLLKEMTPGWNTDDPYRIQFYTQKGFALKGMRMLKEASYEFLKAVSISEEMRQRIKERIGFLGARCGIDKPIRFFIIEN